MILTLLIAASTMVQPVDDFFPLVPGIKWTYEDGNGVQLIEEVGEPIDLGKGRMVTPKTDSISGRDLGTALFHSEGDTVYLIGSIDLKAKKPEPNLLGESQPVLKMGSGKAEWTYLGSVPTSNGPSSLHVQGNSSKGPRRKFLDRDVDTLNVHVVSKFGNSGQAIETQDAVYAKGLGLVEMINVTKAMGQSVKKVLKLVKFEPPQG